MLRWQCLRRLSQWNHVSISSFFPCLTKGAVLMSSTSENCWLDTMVPCFYVQLEIHRAKIGAALYSRVFFFELTVKNILRGIEYFSWDNASTWILIASFEYLWPPVLPDFQHCVYYFCFVFFISEGKESLKKALTVGNRAREYLVFIPDIHLISIFPLNNWSSKDLNGAAVKSKTQEKTSNTLQ